MRQFFLLIQVASKALFSNKLRSFLSITGIVCGVLAVMVMITTGEGAKRKVLSDLAGLGLNNIYIQQVTFGDGERRYEAGSKSYGLSWRDIKSLEVLDFIGDFAGLKEFGILSVGGKGEIRAKFVYVTPSYMAITGNRIDQGRHLLEEDSEKNNLVCVLGARVSAVLGAKGRVGEYLRVGDQLYRIVGILRKVDKASTDVKEIARENSDEMVFLPFPQSAMQVDDAIQSPEHHELSQIIVQVKSSSDVVRASEVIDRLLYVNHKATRDFSIIVPRELLNQALKTQRVFNLFLSVTGGISLFVGGIGIMNIMLANVSERKREIGIRRAVGATRADIILQFLLESVLLTLAGAFIGLFLGYLSVTLIEQLAGWPVHITFLSLLLPFILALSAGIFFGLYPAVQAAKLEPISALKSL